MKYSNSRNLKNSNFPPSPTFFLAVPSGIPLCCFFPPPVLFAVPGGLITASRRALVGGGIRFSFPPPTLFLVVAVVVWMRGFSGVGRCLFSCSCDPLAVWLVSAGDADEPDELGCVLPMVAEEEVPRWWLLLGLPVLAVRFTPWALVVAVPGGDG